MPAGISEGAKTVLERKSAKVKKERAPKRKEKIKRGPDDETRKGYAQYSASRDRRSR